jgi:hypothetical protein
VAAAIFWITQATPDRAAPVTMSMGTKTKVRVPPLSRWSVPSQRKGCGLAWSRECSRVRRISSARASLSLSRRSSRAILPSSSAQMRKPSTASSSTPQSTARCHSQR